MLRTNQGIMDQANPWADVRCWTAGCHGTAGFLRAILRTVNIPVVHEHQSGHALPHFSADGLHLSHGDDPYTQYTFADPPYPISELLIKQSKFDEWFGSDVPDDARKKHVRKRVIELAIQYRPTRMLRDYCNDQAVGKSHAGVKCMPLSSGTDTHSPNSRSINFGPEWMPRSGTWAAAIISTLPPSDRIGRLHIAFHTTLILAHVSHT